MIVLSVDYKLIGQRIKRVRKDKRMTQEQLAEKLSVTVGYVSQIERGVTKINLDILAQIASILNYDIGCFVSGASVNHASYLQDELNNKYLLLNQMQRQMINDIITLFLKYSSEQR